MKADTKAGGNDVAADAETLGAVCDTLLPSQPTEENGALADYMSMSASERSIPASVATALDRMPPHCAEAIAALLGDLERRDFANLSLAERTRLLKQAGEDVPTGRFAVRQLKAMVFGQLLGAFDENCRNPVWEVVGYPGPISSPPPPEAAPKTLPIETVGGEEAILRADVCVIGSGAGGSVIAARLAEAGRSVLVLEAGLYRNEADFRQLEAEGAEMFLGGGTIWAENGTLGLLAGSALGGGTVINSMVCRPTPEDVLESWARMGLEGVDGEEYQDCLRTVWDRIGANTTATVFNRNSELLIAGLGERGFEHHRMPRNASLDDDPRMCGYCNAGCQQGCKRSTTKTYLEDAAAAGARFVVGCKVEQITTADGRATGVEAVVASGSARTRLRVEAETVILAAGGIESPAVLLRSGIGGPAVGSHLQVHPGYMVTGVYEEPVEAWSGQIIPVMSFDLMEDGGGSFLAPLTLSPSIWAGHSPWTDGASSREHFLRFPFMASWHSVSHDHGSGEVVLDRNSQALVRWRLDDEVDQEVARRGQIELARIHRLAGAREVFTFHWKPRRWQEGEDFDAFLDGLRDAPIEDYAAYSAHQMSSCRMGADPDAAVADGRGELHDVKGVWVGDASALPTAPGVNPMVTIMALAERTASRILEAA